MSGTSPKPSLRLLAIGVASGLLLAGCSSEAPSAREAADVLIRGGTVYDGGSGEAVVADVVIAGDRIVYVGADAERRYAAERVIDAAGKVVAPGFIDPHTHPDTYLRSDDPAERRNLPWLMQGATTVMVGVDGHSSLEQAEDGAELEARGIGTNLASYVGFGSVRHAVLGDDARAPDEAELARMRALVAKNMCEGAFGLSTGLFYAPQSFASTEEVVAVAREAAARGGLYDTHLRDESSYSIGLLESVREAIRIGREAGMPVHIGHIKALGVDVHGQAQAVIDLIEAAQAEGLRVTADQYPWLASGTRLEAALLPRWSVDGGREALLRRLDDPATREKIRGEMRENLRRRGGADTLLLTSSGQDWTGKTVAEVAAGWNLEPIDAALRIIETGGPAGRPGSALISFNMDEADVKLFMRQPWVMTSSDGSDGHPRQYATFPKKYAKYVKREGVLSLAEFVHRSTGFTADTLGIELRGYLRPGYYADVVVFDPQGFAPKADYMNPRVLSEGVEQLFVNGVAAVRDGEPTDARAGRVLSHEPPPGSCP